MEKLELARTKIERAINLSESYEDLDPDSLKNVINYLRHALKVMPQDTMEKKELLEYLENLHGLDFKKYGMVFKAETKKSNIILNKILLNELVWRSRSLLF